MNDATVPERIVRCPACAGASVYATTNPSRPFCSARCKNADFGAWASEGYRLASGMAADDTDPSAATPPH